MCVCTGIAESVSAWNLKEKRVIQKLLLDLTGIPGGPPIGTWPVHIQHLTVVESTKVLRRVHSLISYGDKNLELVHNWPWFRGNFTDAEP